MILTLKNIGKIENATVELNGITVIAGENDTGKSTVGKVLHSVFNSFYKLEKQVKKERKENIERALLMMLRSNVIVKIEENNIEDIAETIVTNAEKYRDNPNLLEKDLPLFAEQYGLFGNKGDLKYSINKASKKILEIINIPDDEIIRTVISKKMNAEFNGQINNIYSETKGRVEIKIRKERAVIAINNNNVESISNKFYLNTEAIYIDDPFVLDDERYLRFIIKSNYTDHRIHLKSKLFGTKTEISAINEILTTNKLDSILFKINDICNGEIVRSKPYTYGYKKTGTNKILDIKNISTGLKTFVILKTLLLNGSLEENGTIILDEPEIHLHPEWQLIFAELIILILKEFGMHILLNTHSPYFLNAIEVYAAKYNISDKCNYYIADSKGDTANIIDVTNNIDIIYKKLARPLQELENVRYSDD